MVSLWANYMAKMNEARQRKTLAINIKDFFFFHWFSNIFDQPNRPKIKNKSLETYRTTLREVGNAFSSDKKLSDGFESPLSVDAEIKVVVGEDVDNIVDYRLIHVLCSPTQHFVYHRARHFRHSQNPNPNPIVFSNLFYLIVLN